MSTLHNSTREPSCGAICRCFLFVIVTVFVVACGRPEASTAVPLSVLAEVDGEVITEDEFRYWWDRNPPAADTPEARQRVLDALVARKVIVRKAKEMGIEEDVGVIQAYEGLLVARYKERTLNPKIAAAVASEEDARVYYESLPAERFAQPERVRLAVLWLDSQGDSKRAERYRNRLEEARLKFLQDGALTGDLAAGFGNLAIAFSDHQPTRFKGGVQRWIQGEPADSWLTAALEASGDLKSQGDVSEVIVAPSGVFLVRLVERVQTQKREFAQVRRQLENKLTQERRQLVAEEFESSVRDGKTIVQHPENLERLGELASPQSSRRQPAGFPLAKSIPSR